MTNLCLVRPNWAWAVVLLVGCAEGLPGPDAFRRADGLEVTPPEDPPKPKSRTADSGAAEDEGAAGAGADAGDIDVCEKGEFADCQCEGDQGMGQKTCTFDADSPTMGSFGECEQCVAPPPPAMGAAGAAGGAAGAAAPPPATAAPRMCGMTMCPAPAPGLLGLPPPQQCCTPAGACGTVLLGICI